MKNLVFIFIFFQSCMLMANSNYLPDGDTIASDETAGLLNNNYQRKSQLPGDSMVGNLRFRNQKVRKVLRKAKELHKKFVNKGLEAGDSAISSNLSTNKNAEYTDSVSTIASAIKELDSKNVKIEKYKPKKSKTRALKRKKKNVSKSRSKRRKRRGGYVFFSRGKVSNPMGGIEEEFISLPSGSIAACHLRAGVEIGTDTELVDCKLEMAFLGPNNAYVEMKGCHIWMEMTAKYNLRRLKGKGKKISCRGEAGDTIERPINTQLRDHKDEYIGLKGELNLNNKIIAGVLDFAKGGIKFFGAAMSAAQVTQSLSGGSSESSAVKSANVTGSQDKFLLGKSIEGATGKFLDSTVGFYSRMEPTIAVGPGTKAFVALVDTIKIPKRFFKSKKKASFTQFVDKFNTIVTKKTSKNKKSARVKPSKKATTYLY